MGFSVAGPGLATRSVLQLSRRPAPVGTTTGTARLGRAARHGLGGLEPLAQLNLPRPRPSPRFSPQQDRCQLLALGVTGSAKNRVYLQLGGACLEEAAAPCCDPGRSALSPS